MIFVSCWAVEVTKVADVLFICLVERFYYTESKKHTWDQTFCDLILIFMKTEFQHVLILLIRMLVLVMCLKSEIKISLKLLVAIFFKAQSLQHETTSVKHILYSGQGDFPITVVVGWMRFACGHLRLCVLWVCMEVEVSAFRPANYGGNHGPLFY